MPICYCSYLLPYRYINTNLSLNAVTSTGDKYGMTDETTRTGMSAKRAAGKQV